MAWVVVIMGAGWLRFDHLSDRPFHFDEATGARITAQRIDSASEYQFNPVHNHGPLLSAAASPICALAGESTWKSLTKLSLRLVPAIAGTLLVLVPVLWRRRFGDVPMLAAAALLATSPLLVYFSRMYIHEMLLALCGLVALVLLCGKTRYVWVGIFVGLMFATKESFAITMIAWGGAGVLIAISYRDEFQRVGWRSLAQQGWNDYWKPVAWFLIAAGLTSGYFYTDGMSNPSGAWDAVRTFFIYKTGAGHDKTFFYYFEMLVVPTKGGIWWFETPIFILAVLALLRIYWPGVWRHADGKDRTNISIIRFLAYVTIIHLLIYSIIAYKTPWLMCLPWAYACLLAGLCLRGAGQWRDSVKVTVGLLFVAVLFQQVRITRYATGRFSSSARNPYAYAPTSRDVEDVEQWMADLSKELPPGALEPVGVIGTEYWPLPWYLRDFDAIGYWPDTNPAIRRCPLIIAMPEFADEMTKQLEESHMPLKRTLRAEVPVMLYLRKDHWHQWMLPETSESTESAESTESP